VKKEKLYPPKIPLNFFRWYCHPRLHDYIEGDLIEVYEKRRRQHGKAKADLLFIIDVILLCRPGIIKPMKVSPNLNSYDMYKSYFKISIRQLVKNKMFAAINISVLTLGFSCFILLALYVHDELSFDMFHRDADNMYRLVQHDQQENGTIRAVAASAPAVGKEALEQFPEIEDMCRLSAFGRVSLGNDPLTRTHERALSADPNFFTFFDFPLVEGDAKTALQRPDGIVVSETIKEKYFGQGAALGKQIWSGYMREGQPIYLTISGVMKDFPKNSHLQISILFSDLMWQSMYDNYKQFVNTDWVDSEYTTYFKLKPGCDTAQLTSLIQQLVKSNYPADRAFRSQFELQPLKDIHTQSNNLQAAADEFNSHNIQPFYLYTFAALGIILLLTACLNYMNLATAVAIKRTREIGTRKTLGAPRFQMVTQFITDSVVLSLFSLLLAIAVVYAVLPALNVFSGKALSVTGLPVEWMMGVLLTIFLVGILSAQYPAFITTRVSIVDALKREVKIGSNSISVRKALVVAQFTISIIMVASTLIIYQQLNYLRGKDLGFSHENMVVIDVNSRNLRRNFETVKTEFSKPAEVVSITASTRVPGEWKSFPIATTKSSENINGSEMIFVGIDNDFLKTYDIKLLAGRTINDPVADSLKVVLTQLAVEQLGLTNPIGQTLEIPRVRYGERMQELSSPFRVEIIGVVENFHFESLRANMMPVIFGALNTSIQVIDYYTLKVKTSDWAQTIETLKTINNKIDPDTPLEYTFLDSRFEELYLKDERRGQIFLTLSIVVVIIACLGLFALVSYSVEARTKEIGVRKVMGASVRSIVGLISKEFLTLVIIGGVVGLPIAWFFMQSWLQEFAYRVSFGASVFMLAIFITLFVAFITVGLRAARAARMNPVKSLRSE
jgi:putative ABC transport system permease protein